MFDNAGVGWPEDLAAVPTVELGRLIEHNAEQQRLHDSRVLVLACAWADAHEPPVGSPYGPVVERACYYGGDGTPEVAEFCAAEFAALQGVSFSVGRSLMADAVDVRHRLPKLWASVRAGQVRAWKAQKVAQATRPLPAAAAAEVDEAVAGLVEAMHWPRFDRLLHAAVIDADPELAVERAERARTQRRVWASAGEDGLRTLVARADAGDVTWFLAAVNRIADLLAVRGDTDPVDARRAKAVGWLARPADALALLLDHQTDPDPHHHPAQAREPDDVPDGDRLDDPDLLDEPDLFDESEPEEPEEPEPMGAEWPADLGPDANEPAVAQDEPPDDDREAGGVPVDPQTEAELGHTSLGLSSLSAFNRNDLAKARPRVTLVFHLSDAALRDGGGLVRPEHGDPLTLDQLRAWLTHTGCPVTVRPVVIPGHVEPVDGYEIPHRIRFATRLRETAEIWPYGSCTTATMDLDHTRPYQPMSEGGPPGQTGPGTLGPLSRTVHRAATSGRWGKRQPSPGIYLWRSPHGWTYLVTNQGTLPLGRTPYADAVWHAAHPPDGPAP